MKDVIRSQAEGQDFVNRWAAIADGKPYHIEIKPFKRPKTSEQRAKMHILWRKYAIQLEMDTDKLKWYFKQKFGPAESFNIGRESFIRPISTEGYSVQDASEMIDRILMHAAEHGYHLDD